MPQADGFDMAAFESHLNIIYHNLPTDTTAVGPDLFAPPRNAISAGVAANNPNSVSSDQTTRPAPAKAAEVKVADGPREAQAANATEAAAAKNRLSEEALLADPAAMRKLFPVVMKDMGIKYGSHLNMSDITTGLQDPKLPQTDKDFLTVLKAGYSEFSRDTSASSADNLKADGLGVSADSLTILDKSLNRSISDDPVHRHDAEFGWLNGFSYGATFGSAIARVSHVEPRTAAIIAGVGAVGAALIYEWSIWGGSEKETKSYDHLKSDYQSFVKDFAKTQAMLDMQK